MSTKPRYALRVIKGGYAPADGTTAAALRGKHRVGDRVFVQFSKPRNTGFHKLAHALGGLLAENIEAFAHMDAHTVLKRLQIEGGIGCDEIGVNFPGIGPCAYRIPRSLSYESLDQDEFHEVIESMCKYVSAKYWPSVSPEKIEAMAEVWVQS